MSQKAITRLSLLDTYCMDPWLSETGGFGHFAFRDPLPHSLTNEGVSLGSEFFQASPHGAFLVADLSKTFKGVGVGHISVTKNPAPPPYTQPLCPPVVASPPPAP